MAGGEEKGAFLGGIFGNIFKAKKTEEGAGTSPSPVLTTTTMVKPHPEAKTKNRSYQSYDIKKGDTLWGISCTFGVTVEDLMEANGLFDDTIYAGEKLSIPK